MNNVKKLTNYFQTLLKDEVNENSTFYAIVDAAIHKDFTKTLHMEEEESYGILLKEPLAQKVEKAAPYLVQLNLKEEYTKKLMKEGFATNWLTYLLSHKSLNELQNELKEMIMPYSEQHQREILFRFYDPRNIENYLMIHEEEELEAMFEDIGGSLFVVNSKINNILNYYHLENTNDFVDLEEF